MRSGRPSWLLAIAVAAVVALALSHRDEIRVRAEDALGRGMPAREAALARGFVLGQDDRIDSATIENFRRAGLSHLLAISGQNVALLALLAMPLLAALGMPLRVRLVWILGAIAVYVPLAGGGPSIVRAGVMGALTLLATLGGRRSSRLYGLLVAATATLAIDPRIGADVGWQLSFAAVLGILVLAGPLRHAIQSRLGRGGWRRTLAEGMAITIAATLATAPLIAFHFESFSTTTLLANLLAMPAVAPAMWLGMLTAAAGQVPGFPAAVLNALAAPLLAYIAQVAAWCGRPSWACVQVRLGPAGLVGAYVALSTAAIALPVLLRRRRLVRLRRPRAAPGRTASFVSDLGAIAAVALAVVGWVAWDAGGADVSIPPRGLRVSVLDVGQGDAILLQPGAGPAVLVDGGPAGEGLAAMLRDAGVEALGLAVVTHEQADHAGGIGELLGGFPVRRLLYARLGRRLRREADAAGVGVARVASGDVLRVGELRIEVLWPPRELLASSLAGADPNAQAVVLLVRLGSFSMLLTADAEAEAVPIETGPVDVLKVAHHGSEDAGLDALLERVAPRLAVISVGEGNSYGHPALATLADLAARRVPVLRTDRDGAIVLEAIGSSLRVLG